jgi:hypothetical protein
MINFVGRPSLFFTLNPAFIHSSSFVSNLDGQNINLELFYDTIMLTKNERCNYEIINPKAQVIFVHTIVNVIFKYMLYVKNTKDLFNNNVGVLGQNSLWMLQNCKKWQLTHPHIIMV